MTKQTCADCGVDIDSPDYARPYTPEQCRETPPPTTDLLCRHCWRFASGAEFSRAEREQRRR